MGDELSARVGPRKLKFAPKIPARKATKPTPTIKREAPEETSSFVLDDELLRRVKQADLAPGRRALKDEKRAAPIQVTFGHQSASVYARSFGTQKPLQKYEDEVDAPSQTLEKEYVEPWDYYSYYPVTLPLRRPYSGNPETLDDEEFGEASESSQHEEAPSNSATELGLMDDGATPKMLFFQLPGSLPLSEKHQGVEDLPAGFMGKLLVYKSGVVKMKLGNTSFDVSSGSKCVFAQDVMGVNILEKQCSLLGELSSRAIVTPDVDTLLDSLSEL